MSELVVDFAGEIFRLAAHQSLTFGREAELEVDSNLKLPPIAGEFRFRAGIWWLTNSATDFVLEVHDRGSFSRMMVSPGTSVPLFFAESSVCFKAGAAVYALELSVKGGLLATGASELATGIKASSNVTLNADQHLLLVALAEPLLRAEVIGGVRMPTNRAVADRLGWRTAKFNRKLDHLCLKFTRLGVVGLKGDQSSLAGNRRQILVDHVLASEIITAEDLEILEAHVAAPASAALMDELADTSVIVAADVALSEATLSETALSETGAQGLVCS